MCSVFWQVSCSMSLEDLRPSDIRQCPSLSIGPIFPSRAPGSTNASNSLHHRRKKSHRNRFLRPHLPQVRLLLPVAQHLSQVRLLFPDHRQSFRIRMVQLRQQLWQQVRTFGIMISSNPWYVRTLPMYQVGKMSRLRPISRKRWLCKSSSRLSSP